jgi:hypothetical protein
VSWGEERVTPPLHDTENNQLNDVLNISMLASGTVNTHHQVQVRALQRINWICDVRRPVLYCTVSASHSNNDGHLSPSISQNSPNGRQRPQRGINMWGTSKGAE